MSTHVTVFHDQNQTVMGPLVWTEKTKTKKKKKSLLIIFEPLHNIARKMLPAIN